MTPRSIQIGGTVSLAAFTLIVTGLAVYRFVRLAS